MSSIDASFDPRHAAHLVLNACRYGYAESVGQGVACVAALLDRIQGLVFPNTLLYSRGGCRYGYVESVRQDLAFVEALLDRIQGLLLHKLQELHATSPSLRHDLGDSQIFPTPVR